MSDRITYLKRFDPEFHERYEYCFRCGNITNEKDLTLMGDEWNCTDCVTEALGASMEAAAINDIQEPWTGQPCGCGVLTEGNRPDYLGKLTTLFFQGVQ